MDIGQNRHSQSYPPESRLFPQSNETAFIPSLPKTVWLVPPPTKNLLLHPLPLGRGPPVAPGAPLFPGTGPRTSADELSRPRVLGVLGALLHTAALADDGDLGSLRFAAVVQQNVELHLHTDLGDGFAWYTECIAG